eukprot:3671713-Ditylum_brightwellii.AAC.1
MVEAVENMAHKLQCTIAVMPWCQVVAASTSKTMLMRTMTSNNQSVPRAMDPYTLQHDEIARCL